MNWLWIIPATYSGVFAVVYLIIRGMESFVISFDGKRKGDIWKRDRFLLALWTPGTYFTHEKVFERDTSFLHYILNEDISDDQRASIRFALFHAVFAGLFLVLGMITRLIILVIVVMLTPIRRKRWVAVAEEAARAEEEERLARRTYEARRNELEQKASDLAKIRIGLENLSENLEGAKAPSESEEERSFRHEVRAKLEIVSVQEEGLRTKLCDLDEAKDKLDRHKTYCGLLTNARQLLPGMPAEADCDSPGYHLQDEIKRLGRYVEETMRGAELMLIQQANA